MNGNVSVAELASRIAALAADAADEPALPLEEQLSSDALLPPSYTPISALYDPSLYRPTVLLTGATGFLGSQILVSLLSRSPVGAVVCLVRASDVEQACGRLSSVLEKCDCTSLKAHLSAEQIDEGRCVTEALKEGDDTATVYALPGDLSETLSLSEDIRKWLEDHVDIIIHCGALVNSILPYEEMRRSNVLGTRALLALAEKGRPKYMHYVSTSGTLAANPHSRELPLSGIEEAADRLPFVGGYNQSKYVAELLVTRAARRGLASVIYRPGRISASHCSGFTNANDYFVLIMRSIIETKLAPITSDIPCFSFVPVDSIANGLALLVASHCTTDQMEPVALTSSMSMTAVDSLTMLCELSGDAELSEPVLFNTVNNRSHISLPRLLTWIESFGYTFERLPYQDWVLRLGIEHADCAMAPLLPRFKKSNPFEHSSLPNISAFRFEDLCESNGLPLTELTEKDLHRSLEFLVAHSVLPPPPNE